MSKHNYIPSGDAGFNQFFKSITQYVTTKCLGSTPEWAHIPKEDRDELNASYAAWYTAYALTFQPHGTDITKEKNRVRKETEAVLREFVNRFLRHRPVTNNDRDLMGIPNRKTTRTAHYTVNELVEFEVKLRGIRELEIRFWIKGASHRAKPVGYDGAVIVWDVLDAPPKRPEDLNRHAMASRTPYTLRFDETERGKSVYIALAWQNERGNTGQWSEIQPAIIP